MLLWKRIKLEDFQLPQPVDYKKTYVDFDRDLGQGVEFKEFTRDIDFTIEEKDYNYIEGLGKKFICQVEDDFNAGIYLKLPRKTKLSQPIRLNFLMDEANSLLVDRNLILVGAHSQVSLVFDYDADPNTKAFHNGLTTVVAEEGAVVNIIKLQRLSEKCQNFDTNRAYVRGDGQVNWISIELGSQVTGADFTSFLENEASQSSLRSIYLGDGDRKLDLQYSMIHEGARSNSIIESRGVLMDNSHKVFRGNLDFRKGARRSLGVEEEYVILLDPTVKSDSIPALLCGEDDVEGEHAASAGQIDKNKLFYLMSRGLSEREAKKLIIESNFRPIIEYIPFEDLRDTIRAEISRRLNND